MGAVLDAVRAELPALPPPDARFAERLEAWIAEHGDLPAQRAVDLYLAWTCATGDDGAVRTFRERYGDDMRRALARISAAGASIDDLEQELARRLFVQPSPKIAEYTGRGDLRAWLRVVATRTALDIVRVKRNAERPAADEAAVLALEAPVDAPELAYMKERYRREVAAALEKAAQSLDPEERNALRDHYARGLTVDQIAAVHGIHRATAARRVQRARELLVGRVKRILADEHGLREQDLMSVMNLVQSNVHVTLERVLAR